MFYGVWGFYVMYRLFELVISKRNDKAHDFFEVGKEQKKYMMFIHISWFLALFFEYLYRGADLKLNMLNIFIIVLLFLSAVLRYLSMRELKDMWSTSVYLIEEERIVRTGIYKYFRHPNYFAVILEIFLIPFLFKLNITAVVFTILNGIFLYKRMSLENSILKGEYYERFK
ncbi:hypothetical protein BIY24_03860 [Halobacteriovorax marinus]|uniref:isoprenylcysteine carboxylmethyltransferase family protein n=1 Tax=Halobacteriovorax marinus TaxID=97084 RepID=UPI000BC35140|nr:isoprenylcysteine carboxylmethyltransferase family protein [Halobacteriovorax marinus]ATH07102.1 hypothetical protein BIY24_03860 [Halobacteriovorax marinus]